MVVVSTKQQILYSPNISHRVCLLIQQRMESYRTDLSY